MACVVLAAAGLSAQGTAFPAEKTPDLKALLESSLKAAQANRKLSEDYTWRETRIVRKLDKSGSVKEQYSRTLDVTLIDGEEHMRLVLEDGEPLSADKERKEQEKLNKAIAATQRESPADRERRLRRIRKEKAEWERLLQAIPEAFRFELLGEEMVEGRETWKLSAAPNPKFRPYNRESRMLTKLRGTLWIDKESLIWLRAEVETLDTISFGLVLARVDKGSAMEFEQQLVNGEVWVPRRTEVHFGARLALVRKLRASAETLFSEYKKFSADSQVVSTTVVEKTQ